MESIQPHVSPTLKSAEASDVDSADRSRRSPAHDRRGWWRLLIGTILVGVTVATGMLTGVVPNPLAVHGSTHVSDDKATSKTTSRTPMVKVVRPKHEQSAEILLERMATIEPYYRADLRTRASGIVKLVHHEIGEEVTRGEVLIEIDVPESDQEVAQKQALIVQRQQELKVSESKRKDAQAVLGVTMATISQRKADVQAITATRDLKKRRFDRYQDLAARGSVVGSVVEEEERDYLASEAALLAATANVTRAQADHAESASKIETAAADVDLKEAQIEVAKTDLNRARVIADYGKVVAPFDGVVVRRNVDEGSFVQNATTGTSETLISVSRIDLLTVVAQFPDNAAPYITQGTPASIQISDYSGGAISTKVTRISPTIQNSDRTMRVEVDLFNGGPEEHDRIVQLSQTGKIDRMLKGKSNTFPDPAFATNNVTKRLLPGMNCSIRLAIGGAGTSYILPSTAVFSKSGAKYILVVANGKTQSLPVRVQLNDGQRVRIAIVTRKISLDGTAQEELVGLRGDEDVVATNQLQVGDDVQVRISPTDW